MKRFGFFVAICLACSCVLGGGELASKKRLKISEPEDLPINTTTSVVTKQDGFFTRAGRQTVKYFCNRAYDVCDVVLEGADAVLGVVTIDIAHDDVR